MNRSPVIVCANTFAIWKYVDALFDIILRASFNHLCGRIHLPFPTLPILLSLDWTNMYKQTVSNNSKRLKRKQNTQKHGERSGAVVSIRKSIGRRFEISISSGVVDICVSLLLYQQGKKRRERERERKKEREGERESSANTGSAYDIFFLPVTSKNRKWIIDFAKACCREWNACFEYLVTNYEEILIC